MAGSTRQVMEEVHRLFDQRCRTRSALDKLRKLQYGVKCFRNLGQTLQTLFSPNLEKALTFLDDSLLPATSNAVERGNRRHRKTQKSVYRVRTHHAMVCPMALDLLRNRQHAEHWQTLATLHYGGAGWNGPDCHATVSMNVPSSDGPFVAVPGTPAPE